MSDDNIVSIKVLDRSYGVKCPASEEQQLQEAARYLEEQTHLVRQSGTITSVDRVLAVTALNLAHELLLLKKQKNQYVDEVRDRVQGLQSKIENFLSTDEEVAV